MDNYGTLPYLYGFSNKQVFQVFSIDLISPDNYGKTIDNYGQLR